MVLMLMLEAGHILYYYIQQLKVLYKTHLANGAANGANRKWDIYLLKVVPIQNSKGECKISRNP